MAQQISVAEALSRATSFLQNQPTAHRAQSNSNEAIAYNRQLTLAYTARHLKNEKACFYVFNRGENNGFIIMGGDEAAKEVLGYSNTGAFDYDHAPANFLWWLSQYQQDISAAIDYVAKYPEALTAMKQNKTARGMHKAIAERHDVEPLIATKWSQAAPYYNAINADFNAQTGYTDNAGLVTGCVATAMAQVMNYYKWPLQGKGQHSYTNEVQIKDMTFTPSADFGATTYDWDNMVNIYDANATAAQNDAVAQLMYHCGVAVDMVFTDYMSGAIGQLMPNALCTYFDYDKSVRNEQRVVFTDEEWEDLVYSELAAGRPVLYGGTSNNIGHQFICDGYRTSDGFYSFNWGWAGNSDGYYTLTGKHALQPNSSGIGGDGDGAAYTQGQSIVTNVMRENGGKERIHFTQLDLTDYNHPNSLYMEYDSEVYDKLLIYKHSDASYKRLSLYSSLMNVSATYTGGMTGIKATNRNTVEVIYFSGQYQNIPIGYFYTDPVPNSFNVNLLKDNGVYELRPVVRPVGNNDDWEEIDIMTTEAIPTVIVTNANAVAPLNVTFSVPSNELQKEHTMQIKADEAYTGNVTYSSSDESIATVSDDGVITGVAEGTAVITINADDMVVDDATIFTSTEQEMTITITQADSGDFPTGIQQSTVSPQYPAGIYSIDGIKRNTLRQGLNIIIDEQGGRRKVMNK